MLPNFVVDLQTAFLGLASNSDLLKMIRKLCLRHNPSLPTHPTAVQQEQAYQHLMFSRRYKSEMTLGRELLMISAPSKRLLIPDSLRIAEHKMLRNKVRSSSRWEERKSLGKAQGTIHGTADLNCIIAQLEGTKPPSAMHSPVEHILQKRNQITSNLFLPVTDASCATIIDIMARLYSHQDRRSRSFSEDSDPPKCMGVKRDHGEVDELVLPSKKV